MKNLEEVAGLILERNLMRSLGSKARSGRNRQWMVGMKVMLDSYSWVSTKLLSRRIRRVYISFDRSV